MLGQDRNPNATPAKVASVPMRLMRRLLRHGIWAFAAAAALLAAFLSVRSDVGEQRVAFVLASMNLPTSLAAAQPSDTETTQQLVQAVRDLKEDRDRLLARLAAVEHGVEDITGSVKQEGHAEAAAGIQMTPPWPDAVPPVPMTPADIAAMVKSVGPPASPPQPNPSALAAPAAAAPPADAALGPPPYGADIARAASVQALHSHWVALRSAHPELFDGLQPVVSLRDSARSKHIELHLVVGPFSNAEGAAQLCGLLAAFHIPCQPAMFDGPHLALQ
jgi:hypothetical protein